MLTLTKTEYQELEHARDVINVLLAKSRAQEKKKQAKQEQKATNSKVKELLAMYGVFNEQDFKQEKEMLKEFENAYNIMGATKFESVLKRVHEYNLKAEIKSLKAYTLKAVQKEAKGGKPNA